MHNSKLIVLLKSLNDKELDRLVDFVNSDYFNKNQDTRDLLTYLGKLDWNFEHADLKKEIVYKKLFPSEPYRDEDMRVRMSRLTELVKQFLSVEKFQKDELMTRFQTLNAYMDKGIDKYFLSMGRNIQRKMGQETCKGVEHYYMNYLFSQQFIEHHLGRGGKKLTRTPKDVMDTFELYYLSNKVRYCASIVSTQTIYEIGDASILMFDELLDILKKNKLALNDGGVNCTPLDIPIIRYYYHVLIAFIERENETHFINLKELLFSDLHTKIPDFDLRQIYNMYTTYCVQKIRQGKPEYYQHLFDMYQEALSKDGVLIMTNHIHQTHYYNIVRVALAIKEGEWAENFIHEYKNLLKPEYRETVSNYCLAELYYDRGEREAAIRILNTVELINSSYYFRYKILLLKSYFESGHFEPLRSIVGNVRDWIGRDEMVSKQIITNNRNFFNFAIRLTRIRERLTNTVRSNKEVIQKDVEKMRLEILDAVVVEKKWLLEQIDAF